VLSRLAAPPAAPPVIIGLAEQDDAGVFRLSEDLALVHTVDFFTPVVDDPFDFGRVAAANALSDVYAMAARPVSALNVTAFPIDHLGGDVLADILRGGLETAGRAGVAILGGHTVDSAEPMYGLAVTGLVRPDRLLRIAGARPGDVLLLTKPIGVGVATTALRAGDLSTAQIAEVTDLMARLNDQLDALSLPGVHACTDVTGFGLMGHALEMARAGGVRIRIDACRVPVLEWARAFAVQGRFPAGSRRNLDHVRPHSAVAPEVDPVDLGLLADAVTSGGLLLAVAADRTEVIQRALLAGGAAVAAVVGEVEAGPASLRIER
jgi:selenide,water dikinase